MNVDGAQVNDNDRTAWIFVAFSVVMTIAFVATIYALAFYDGWL